MKYFENIKCVEDLKAMYRKLAMKFHPDRGGSTEIMQEINAEYERLFEKYKNIHKGKDFNTGKENTYEAKTATKETAGDFINIIDALLKMGGLTVELCGRWLWIGGNTMEHKDRLKAIGCKWSSVKKLWSWHFPEDGTVAHKSWDMNKIRDVYGSEHFTESREEAKIALNA